MAMSKVFLGNSVIVITGTDGTIVGNKQLHNVRALFVMCPTLTAAAHLEVGPAEDSLAAAMVDLYVGATQATLASLRASYWECGGFLSVRVVSAGAEAAERTIPIWAIIEI